MKRTREDCLRTLREKFTNFATNVAMRDLLIELFEQLPEEKIPGKDFEGVFAIGVQVVLNSGYATGGALTIRPDGMLHVAQPAQIPNPVARSAPPLATMAHHYFSIVDLQTVIVVDVTEAQRLAQQQPAPSRLVT